MLYWFYISEVFFCFKVLPSAGLSYSMTAEWFLTLMKMGMFSIPAAFPALSLEWSAHDASTVEWWVIYIHI